LFVHRAAALPLETKRRPKSQVQFIAKIVIVML